MSVYISDISLYCITVSNDQYALYRIDYTNNIQKVCDTNITVDNEIGCFAVDNNYAIFSINNHEINSIKQNGIYIVNLFGDSKTEKFTDVADRFLCCNGELYIYSGYNEKNKGLYNANIQTQQIETLSDNNIYGVYILDNDWIYYQTDDDTLRRINPSNNVDEIVFSMQ